MIDSYFQSNADQAVRGTGQGRLQRQPDFPHGGYVPILRISASRLRGATHRSVILPT